MHKKKLGISLQDRRKEEEQLQGQHKDKEPHRKIREDGTIAEYFKNSTDTAIIYPRQFFNNVYESGVLPEDWLKSPYLPLLNKQKARKY